jgi:CheY-like chemotaxis protein
LGVSFEKEVDDGEQATQAIQIPGDSPETSAGRGSDWPRPDGGGGLPGDWGDGGHVLPICPTLDIRLLGVRGLDFQIHLTETVIHIPIIFMTGHGDIPMSVRAMKAGPVDFFG